MDFSGELINWYNNNKRDLPWRNTTNAYLIWLSEIILQQTRVEQGMPYYHRFAEKYPDVDSFANASEDDVLRLWQGLGYYSRGRNMLKTAKTIQSHYHSVFPTAYNELIKLKGIGEYTAAAISSFAANETRAVVDGNVYRVIARYFGVDDPINSTQGKKKFQVMADELLNGDHPALHNQAIMEFGALLCKPKNPACGICPVRTGCHAFLYNAINVLPVKLKTVKVKERFFNYFLVTDADTLLMNKRDDSDIWANMYDLPMIEATEMLPVEELMSLPQTIEYFGGNAVVTESLKPIKHILTHQRLYVRFIKLARIPIKLKPQWIFIEVRNLKKLALPKVIFIFLDKFLN